jgi:hypothetical protein
LGDVDVDPEGAAPVRPVPGRPPNLDRLIQELQRQQDNRIIQAGGAPLASPPPPGVPPRVSRSNSGKYMCDG